MGIGLRSSFRCPWRRCLVAWLSTWWLSFADDVVWLAPRSKVIFSVRTRNVLADWCRWFRHTSAFGCVIERVCVVFGCEDDQLFLSNNPLNTLCNVGLPNLFIMKMTSWNSLPEPSGFFSKICFGNSDQQILRSLPGQIYSTSPTNSNLQCNHAKIV
jgi:hypothetical protein